jgi:DNA-binding NarL/FixJ family response regulator
VRILIADDHEVVRRGLKNLLQDEYGDVRFGEASGARDVYELLREGKWDLIILDIFMPETNVVEIIEHIRAQDSKTPILILTAASETEYALSTLKAGANGYITKQHASEELIAAVRKLFDGETYLSSEAVKALAESLRQYASAAPHEALSKRELEVFCLIAKGKGVKEVAYDMSLSAKTVSTYISRIREKTGLVNYVDIARYALQHKLVDL